MAAQAGTAAKSSEEDNDSGITMLDVLEEEQELEDDANAVLGGSDDQNCTYMQGYVKRQALYACGTCVTSNMEPAGVCLACSYACHEGHELYELYTKRNFRCDCGNSRFPNNSCRLCPVKEVSNSKNKYNQNFWGKYCICRRPYPDPEDDEPDEMAQCIICEDWYHGRHLGNNFTLLSDYSEMICAGCMDTLDFLWPYNSAVQNVTVKKEETNEVVDVDTVKSEDIGMSNGNCQVTDNDAATNGLSSLKTEPLANALEVNEVKPVLEVEEKTVITLSHENAGKGETCILKKLQKFPLVTQKGCTLWPEGWRKKLCRCSHCMQLYRDHSCVYLLEEEDTVHSYEERGKATTGSQSQYDKGMSVLQGLDRVKQVEAIHEYNNMTSELKEYLRKFADSKKVVREADIHEFFSQMKARKRQRTECQIPHHCR